MSNIGELLKRTREEQGLSIHEVSLALKINSKILQAIEDGDKNHLPAKTFLRGFVRSYASYLHLDQKSTMDAFSSEYGSTLPKSNVRPAQETPLQDKGSITESTTSNLSLTRPNDGGSIPKAANLSDHPLSPKLKSIAKEQSVESDVKNNLRWYLIGGAVAVIVGLTLARNLAEKYAKEADTSQLTADLQKAAIKGGTVSTQHLQATIEPERGPEPRSILDVKHGHGEFVPVTNIPATNVAVGNIPASNMPTLGGPVANGPENMMAANQSRTVPPTSVGAISTNPAIPAKEAKGSEMSLTAAKPAEKAQSSPTPSLKKIESVAMAGAPQSGPPSMGSASANSASAVQAKQDPKADAKALTKPTPLATTLAQTTPPKEAKSIVGSDPKLSSTTTTANVRPSPQPSPASKGKPIELIVEALENVEISYSTAGGTPQKVKLNGEQTHTFRSQSGLKLNISNGAAVNIILNGRDLGKPGDAGKPISLTY